MRFHTSAGDVPATWRDPVVQSSELPDSKTALVSLVVSSIAFVRLGQAPTRAHHLSHPLLLNLQPLQEHVIAAEPHSCWASWSFLPKEELAPDDDFVWRELWLLPFDNSEAPGENSLTPVLGVLVLWDAATIKPANGLIGLTSIAMTTTWERTVTQ